MRIRAKRTSFGLSQSTYKDFEKVTAEGHRSSIVEALILAFINSLDFRAAVSARLGATERDRKRAAPTVRRNIYTAYVKIANGEESFKEWKLADVNEALVRCYLEDDRFKLLTANQLFKLATEVEVSDGIQTC